MTNLKPAAAAAVLLLWAGRASAGTDIRLFALARTQVHGFRESLFNPGNLSLPALGWSSGPLFLGTATAEFEADLLSLRWRLDLQGSAGRDENGHRRRDLRVGQLFFQKDLSESWVLLAGRSIQRWGTGYVFNPTDVAGPDRELSDPENAERRAVGRDMVKLEYFTAASSLAFCLLSRLETTGGASLEAPSLAVRYYRNVRDTDLSLVALFHRKETPLFGLNVSRVFGERLEVHGEWSVQKNSYRLYHPVLAETEAVPERRAFVDFKRNDGKLYVQSLLGFHFTFRGGILWVAEYYHQDQGYASSEWKALVGRVRGLGEELAASGRETDGGAALQGILTGLAAYSSKGTLRDYLVNYVQNLGRGPVEWRAGVLLNLSDRSGVLFPELRLSLRGGFTFYLRSTMFFGGGASEFGAFPRARSLEGGLRFRL